MKNICGNYAENGGKYGKCEYADRSIPPPPVYPPNPVRVKERLASEAASVKLDPIYNFVSYF